MKGTGNGGIITDGLIFSVDPLNIKSNPNDNTNSYDLTSYNSSGVFNNGALSSDRSFFLDGVDDYLSFNGDILSPVGNELTIGVWAKYLNHSTYGPLVFKYNGNPSYFEGYTLIVTSGGVQVAIGNGSYNEYTFNYGDYTNQLVYYTGVFDLSNGKLLVYVNGQQVDQNLSIAQTTFTNDLTSSLNIGFSNVAFAGYFGGYVYDVHLYNRVLTQEEILYNYNSLKWKFI